MLFITFFLAATSHASEESATNVCLRLLSKRGAYSLVLNGEEPFVLLTRPLPIVDQVTLATVMARYPHGSAIVKAFPELSKLKWTKTGSWDFHAEAKGTFGRIIRYHISRDAFLAVEMRLELQELNEHLVRALVGSLENKNVSALVSGGGTYLAVYRLDLSDLPTRDALKDFFKFLKRNELNADYVQAVTRSAPL